jgi:hypothetical protein
MIAGSVANNVGLNALQLYLITVEKCADCRFVVLRLQVATDRCTKRSDSGIKAKQKSPSWFGVGRLPAIPILDVTSVARQ